MGAGYQVVLHDLANAASTFTAQSAEVQSLQGILSPAPAETGDPTLDTILRDLLISIGAIHDGIVKQLAAHGSALKTCHDNYSGSNADVARLFQTMMDAYT